MNDKPTRDTRAQQPEMADPLADTRFADLSETFAMRNDDGSIIQERDACYNCTADGFYGHGTQGTWYMEGSIIVTDAVPNEHMEPLNRAAGIRYVNWQRRQPANRVPIDVGDMSEAAIMLAKDPESMSLPPLKHQEAVIKLATALKIKREGLEARDLPQLGHNFVRGTRPMAPPLLGAKMSDMTQRYPGETRMATAIPQVGSGPVTRRAQPAPMGGSPPR